MSTFITTYVIFWAAVAIYVLQLGSRQRKLLNRLSLLQLQCSGQEKVESLK